MTAHGAQVMRARARAYGTHTGARARIWRAYGTHTGARVYARTCAHACVRTRVTFRVVPASSRLPPLPPLPPPRCYTADNPLPPTPCHRPAVVPCPDVVHLDFVIRRAPLRLARDMRQVAPQQVRYLSVTRLSSFPTYSLSPGVFLSFSLASRLRLGRSGTRDPV